MTVWGVDPDLADPALARRRPGIGLVISAAVQRVVGHRRGLDRIHQLDDSCGDARPSVPGRPSLLTWTWFASLRAD